MKASDLRDMKHQELLLQLDKLRRTLFELRSQAVTEKLENPHRVTEARRDIARIHTILRERAGTEAGA